MGCSGSKADDLPLVVRCRERRELIRAAANHRYALAAAHVAYFRSLKDVGDALRKFVDEELVMASPSSSSSFSSPSLTLPPNSKKKHDNAAEESSLHLHDDEDDEESHLHLSDSSTEDEDSEDYKHLHHDHHDHHGHESEDDAHHHHKPHAHVDKGKVFDDEIRRSNHDEEESSFPYPRGGFEGYGSAFGNDEFVNYPYANPYPYPYSYPAPPPYGEPYMDQWVPPPQVQPWFPSSNSNMYYMKKSAPSTKTVVREPPVYGYTDSYWTSPPSYGNVGYGGSLGFFSAGSHIGTGNKESAKEESQKEPPPPPTPKASAWDFFNPFDVVENGYPGYYSTGGYGYPSNASSPDSNEVREREGIPDLEEETESEVYKEVLNGSRMKGDSKKSSVESAPHARGAPVRKNKNGSTRSVPQHHRSENSSRSVPLYKGEGSSRSMAVPKSESSSRSVPSWSSEEIEKPSMPPHYSRESAKTSMSPQYGEENTKTSNFPPDSMRESYVDHSPNEERSSKSISLADESSPENIVLKNVDEGSVKKKGVTFEMEGTSKQDADSSNLSSVTILSPNGTRDLQEVVAEIRDEFETASSYGKEVAMLLEVGKLPYQPSFLKAKLASNTMKMARSYFDNVEKDVNSKAFNLSATLDKLYAWEKKLYKEVKDEERLRVIYEKQCRRLRVLDEEGAESSKIDATRASIRKLLTKLNVSIKAIDGISSRIHKLRDEELQPQVATLIYGLIRMWKAMLKCHRKQFQAIMESKMRKLRANTGLQGDSSLRATTHLERELRAWCARFNDWVAFQKSYVESLNGWLLQCLQYEPEQTPDGPVPYSPGRLGAPPIFVICNDWQQAMEAISEARVANTMNTFATSLQQLWEKQDEERHQRLKAEYLSKDFDKQLKAHRMEKGKMKLDQDGRSDKTGLSMVPSSDSGVSALDDLKVDLDSMKQKLAEERVKHKDAMKVVHDAATSSLQGGLIPIFKALENFTSEALKAHEHVRLQPSNDKS
ncbi:nitrate regulatory gene2 protein-like isoform X2 [Andrographis paniculata]|uniref:nitrate regulatory gene2 protein-like isoform X2 n=1 Tax=Andrographis paniculata TaxID=175694 RepID=UPI0021E8558E|nr:nitrate regulatory gene2 protein-like isoform X2 [Andrographis paniculata]